MKYLINAANMWLLRVINSLDFPYGLYTLNIGYFGITLTYPVGDHARSYFIHHKNASVLIISDEFLQLLLCITHLLLCSCYDD